MSSNTFIKVLFTITTLLLLACGNNSVSDDKNPFADCKFGSPQAIFSKDIDQIDTHTFDIRGKAGFEKIKLKNGKHLEIVSTGCNYIQQELLFTLPSNNDTTTLVNLAANELSELGEFSVQHGIFKIWAGAIIELSSEFSPGKEVELEPGKFVSLDKIKRTDNQLLRIILSMK